MILVSSGATATANNVSAFVADSDTTNAGTATINAASGGSTINMTDSASGAYTLAGGAGVDN